MRIERIPLGTGSAVALADLKVFARIDHDDEDLILQMMADAAAREIEHHAQIALLTQEIVLTFDSWPCGDAVLVPVGPAQDAAPFVVAAGARIITAISPFYGDRAGFRLDPLDRTDGPLTVSYRAGFGDTASDVPADLRTAICAQVVTYYDDRAGFDSGQFGLSAHAARIAGRYRGVRL